MQFMHSCCLWFSILPSIIMIMNEKVKVVHGQIMEKKGALPVAPIIDAMAKGGGGASGGGGVAEKKNEIKKVEVDQKKASKPTFAPVSPSKKPDIIRAVEHVPIEPDSEIEPMQDGGGNASGGGMAIGGDDEPMIASPKSPSESGGNSGGKNSTSGNPKGPNPKNTGNRPKNDNGGGRGNGGKTKPTISVDTLEYSWPTRLRAPKSLNGSLESAKYSSLLKFIILPILFIIALFIL